MQSIIRTLIIFCAIPAALQAAEQRPNIVFILSDDQAWMDYGFMGHPDIKTPHLDKLASRSMAFGEQEMTRFEAASSFASPLA